MLNPLQTSIIDFADFFRRAHKQFDLEDNNLYLGKITELPYSPNIHFVDANLSVSILFPIVKEEIIVKLRATETDMVNDLLTLQIDDIICFKGNWQTFTSKTKKIETINRSFIVSELIKYDRVPSPEERERFFQKSNLLTYA